MGDITKPLFNRHLLAEQMKRAPRVTTEVQRGIAAEWAASAADPAFRRQTEKSLQGAFLARMFELLLGYPQIVGHAERYRSTRNSPPGGRLISRRSGVKSGRHSGRRFHCASGGSGRSV